MYKVYQNSVIRKYTVAENITKKCVIFEVLWFCWPTVFLWIELFALSSVQKEDIIRVYLRKIGCITTYFETTISTENYPTERRSHHIFPPDHNTSTLSFRRSDINPYKSHPFLNLGSYVPGTLLLGGPTFQNFNLSDFRINQVYSISTILLF